MNRKELRELYQRRTGSSPRGAADCLSQESLMRAGIGELRLAERQRVANHLRICSDCAQDYLIARSHESWAKDVTTPSRLAVGQASEGVGTRNEAAQPGWFAWDQLAGSRRRGLAYVMAVILAVVGISLTVWKTNHPLEPSTPIERGRISSSITFEPPDRALLREPPARLAWSAVESAEDYQVTLYDFESTTIWESTPVTDNFVTIPESVRRRFLPTQPYYWRVSVDTDTERRQMPLLQFVVTTEARK